MYGKELNKCPIVLFKNKKSISLELEFLMAQVTFVKFQVS